MKNGNFEQNPVHIPINLFVLSLLNVRSWFRGRLGFIHIYFFSIFFYPFLLWFTFHTHKNSIKIYGTVVAQFSLNLRLFNSNYLRIMVQSSGHLATEQPFTIQTIIMISTNIIKTIKGAKKYCIFYSKFFINLQLL